MNYLFSLIAKRFILTIFFLLFFLFGVSFVFAQEPIINNNDVNTQVVKIFEDLQVTEKVPVVMFVRDSCKHCKDAKAFFDSLLKERDDFSITYFNLKDDGSYEIWQALTEKNNISKVTPLIFLSNTFVQGFDVPETTGKRIVDLIIYGKTIKPITLDDLIAGKSVDGLVSIKSEGCVEDSTECAVTDVTYIFNVPFFGIVDLYEYSLPVMSFILGLIDGFNPCAMWVLVTFLLMLMQVGSRRKMLQIAGLFIFAETVMYYGILTLWFTAWDFIGLDRFVTPVIGAVAVGGGIFFLYEFYKLQGQCKIINPNERSKIVGRIKKMTENNFTFISALGVIGLAFSVNIIEFACSIGIPQAYTKIIEINNLGFWETHGNMFLYILAYMIDDFIVFGIALYGIEKLHLATRYTKFSNLIGGILMILLGLILIFAREFLVF